MRPLLLISILALIVFFQINGEKIPANEGAYGDGVFYREVGRNFLDDMEESGYNLVQLTRILPFGLLNLSFSAFHIVKDNQGLQNGMIIWQVIYLGIALYWYFRISKKLRLKPAIFTLGFILLFANYAWLKSLWYHPFSPDGMAFALGMGQVNYFLRYEKFKLGMVSILGTFVSPLLLISGLLMLFLPGDKLPLHEGERPKSLFPAALALALPVLFALLGWGLGAWWTEDLISQIFHLVALAFIPFLVIYAAKKSSIDWDLAIQQFKKRTKSDRISKGVMALVGILLLLILLSGKNETLGLLSLARESARGMFRFPGDFILSNSLHWGLIGVLTLLYLYRFLQEMGKLGWSVVLIFALGLLFSLFFKATTFAAWIPLWAIILIKGMKRYRWSVKDQMLLGIVALVFSLFWLSINTDELALYLGGEGGSDLISEWAVQKWAMHQHGLISFGTYALLALAFGLFTLSFYWRKKRYLRQMGN
ncbi:hypothetical protein SAMN04488104_100740 [Algoriphagus faecimaris]|uniref:Uncharacterized protein n=1 Tax=Algoriphagus faecimaris TaxID=686796 RepID=A0A1G6PUM8_9BACT|nr:hypothetical protein [Algoriphagus faecimaris]SDC83374.1 hypothetical protein SAMN04488104_100740 [Algoriphagus faecimaris]